MGIISAILDFFGWILMIVMCAFPIICGLVMCIRSPLAPDGKMRCYYCKERINVTASICPHCRRRNTSYAASGFKSRFGQFIIGFFAGFFVEFLLVGLMIKFLQFFGF